MTSQNGIDFHGVPAAGVASTAANLTGVAQARRELLSLVSLLTTKANTMERGGYYAISEALLDMARGLLGLTPQLHTALFTHPGDHSLNTKTSWLKWEDLLNHLASGIDPERDRHVFGDALLARLRCILHRMQLVEWSSFYSRCRGLPRIKKA